jgi:hypothetical protein
MAEFVTHSKQEIMWFLDWLNRMTGVETSTKMGLHTGSSTTRNTRKKNVTLVTCGSSHRKTKHRLPVVTTQISTNYGLCYETDSMWNSPC